MRLGDLVRYLGALKAKIFEGRGRLYLGYTVALGIGFVFSVWIRRAKLPPASLAAGLALVAMMFGALLISLLGDPLDSIRHSWLFLGLSDTVLVATLLVIS